METNEGKRLRWSRCFERSVERGANCEVGGASACRVSGETDNQSQPTAQHLFAAVPSSPQPITSAQKITAIPDSCTLNQHETRLPPPPQASTFCKAHRTPWHPPKPSPTSTTLATEPTTSSKPCGKKERKKLVECLTRLMESLCLERRRLSTTASFAGVSGAQRSEVGLVVAEGE